MLRWELEAIPTGTRLRFTNTLVPGEPRYVTMSLGGWHLHLDHLYGALEGESPDWTRWYPDYGPAWQKVHDEYREATALS
jgi:hypothetical protein